MAQHYVDPHLVAVPPNTRRPSKKVIQYLQRDGQIVPLLVVAPAILDDYGWADTMWLAADFNQAERVIALRMLGYDTILIEDEWEDEDL